MGQYKEGTVDVTNGSAAVVGTGTQFETYLSAGDLFTIQNSGAFYEIASITDETHLTLTSTYGGTTAEDADYFVVQDFTPVYDIPEIAPGDVGWPDILKRSLRRIDEVLGLLDLDIAFTVGNEGTPGADQRRVSIQVKSQAGVAQAEEFLLDIWVSADSTGALLTTDTVWSSPSAGVDVFEHQSNALRKSKTNSSGVYTADFTVTGAASRYIFVSINGRVFNSGAIAWAA